MIARFVKKLSRRLSPEDLVPIVAIESLNGFSVVVLENLAWVVPFRLEGWPKDALSEKTLATILSDLTGLMASLTEVSPRGVLLSFSAIKRRLRECEYGESPQTPQGYATWREFLRLHRDLPFVSSSAEKVRTMAFSWDTFGALAFWERNPARARERIERIVSALRSRERIRGLSPREVLAVTFQHFAPWRMPPRVPQKAPVMDFASYLLASEAVVLREEGASFAYDGYTHLVFRLESVVGLSAEREESGEPVPADLAAFLVDLPFPFRYFVNIYVPPQEAERRRIDAMRGFAKGVATLGSAAREANLEKHAALSGLLAHVAKTGDVFVRLAAGLVLFEKDRRELESRAAILARAGAQRGLMFAREKISALKTAFVRSVPTLAAADPEFPAVTHGKAGAVMVPHVAPFRGDTPHLLVLTRSHTPAGITLISEKSAKWGAVVVAPSGSGKTFFMNCLFLFTLSLASPPFVVVLDMSTRPSYLGLVQAFRGLHLDLDLAAGGINPLEFKFPLRKPPTRHLAFLTDRFFPALFQTSLTAVEKTALDLALEETYSVFLRPDYAEFSPKRIEDSELADDPRFNRFETLLEARDHYLARGELELAELAHRHAMPTLADLAQILGSSTRIRQAVGEEAVSKVVTNLTAYTAGPHSRFFSSPSAGTHTLNFESPLIYVEFAKVLSYPSLLPAVFLLLRHYLIEKTTVFPEDEIFFRETKELAEVAFRLKTRPKIFAYDEWHNLKDNELALAAVDYDFRQGRTMKRVPVLITQSAKDVDKESILVNAATKILLSHLPPDNPDETALAAAREVFRLDKRLFEALASLRIVKGEYSEALVLTEGAGAGVIRLYPTSEILWTVTSDATSLGVREAVVRNLMNEGFDFEKAFRKAVAALARLAPHEKDGPPPEKLVEEATKLARSLG